MESVETDEEMYSRRFEQVVKVSGESTVSKRMTLRLELPDREEDQK